MLFSQTILQIFHICVSHLDFLLCQRLPIKRLPSPADPLAHSVEWWLMCTPSSLTQLTTNDRVSLNDMHLKVVALRHRCFSGQVETDHPTSFEKNLHTDSNSGPIETHRTWAQWQPRSLHFSWRSQVGSLFPQLCLQTTGRCPLWTGQSSPQQPFGPTCGKHVWLIPLVCRIARTFLQCWLWMVSFFISLSLWKIW